jgi:hypothetical protein
MVRSRSKRLDAARSTAHDPVVSPSALPALVTWESELRAIAEEAPVGRTAPISSRRPSASRRCAR